MYWGSIPDIAKMVSMEEVTKDETITIVEIYAYIKQKSSKNVAVHGIILPALIVKLRPQEAFLIDEPYVSAREWTGH
ncbi:hypothetical protein Bca52824_010194 [Brassica carinata]|uniref:Uncharacterized protein n=1 Tax=Brassica carinata TaxID=52824 RepID=A0A8X7WC80_BRACI|nr:hypothetical protein Bca52824_010194 [Brassica carinata]